MQYKLYKVQHAPLKGIGYTDLLVFYNYKKLDWLSNQMERRSISCQFMYFLGISSKGYTFFIRFLYPTKHSIKIKENWWMQNANENAGFTVLLSDPSYYLFTKFFILQNWIWSHPDGDKGLSRNLKPILQNLTIYTARKTFCLSTSPRILACLHTYTIPKLKFPESNTAGI